MPKANVTKAAIQRAIEATKSCGLSISGVEVEADGTIRVITTLVDKIKIPDDPRRPKQW
jgi:hypothetical protein